MSGEWIKPLAKAAKRSPQGVYYTLKKSGAKPPYSELFTWTLLRAKGLPCKGYQPVADAVGKPEPPLLSKANGKAAKANGHAAPAAPVVVVEPAQAGSAVVARPIVRLAKLLGRPDKNNMNRIRYYLKQSGIKKTKNIDEAAALEVLARRGIDTSKFEYAQSPGTPGIPAKVGTEPADNYDALLIQYNELVARMARTREEINERDAKLDSLNNLRVKVRDTLKEFQNIIMDVGKARFGGLPTPLDYAINAYNAIVDWERQQSKRAAS